MSKSDVVDGLCKSNLRRIQVFNRYLSGSCPLVRDVCGKQVFGKDMYLELAEQLLCEYYIRIGVIKE